MRRYTSTVDGTLRGTDSVDRYGDATVNGSGRSAFEAEETAHTMKPTLLHGYGGTTSRSRDIIVRLNQS